MEMFEECALWWMLFAIVGAPICPVNSRAWFMRAVTRVCTTVQSVLLWMAKRLVSMFRWADRVGRWSVVAVLNGPVRTSRR